MAKVHDNYNRPFLIKSSEKQEGGQYSFVDPKTFEWWPDSYHNIYMFDDLGYDDLGFCFEYGFAMVSMDEDCKDLRLVSVGKNYVEANKENLALAKSIYRHPHRLGEFAREGKFAGREAEVAFYADIAMANAQFEKQPAEKASQIMEMAEEVRNKYLSSSQPGEE